MDRDSSLISRGLLERFLEFSSGHLGLRERTLQGYAKELKLFFNFLRSRRIRSVRDVALDHLDAFLIKRSKLRRPVSLKHVYSHLRGFFRFLFLEGTIPSNPAQWLTPPCRFRDDLRPKYIPWAKVEELLAGVDRRMRAGKRDFAVLVLLSHYGLRAREVGRLCLSDIRWKSRSFCVRSRKNGKSAVLPLSALAERALKDYLSVRPKVPFPEVFLTSQIPFKPLEPHTHAVAARHLARRFGKSWSPRGSHVLRHSFAKALLDRGAPMTAIQTLLGHKSLAATLVYTRVDTETLREAADNYASLL